MVHSSLAFLPGKHAVESVDIIVRGASILMALGFVAAACGGEAFTSGGGPADGSAGSATAGTGGSDNSGGAMGSGGTDPGGSAGTGLPDAGTGGTGGQAGHGGSSGAGGSDAGGTCPPTLPSSSQTCAPEGLSCSYGKCCPTRAVCSGGKWQITMPACAVPGCPPTAPTQGASCTCVSTPVPCHYDCATSMKSIDATCVNDVWSTQITTCAAVPCGASMCMPGQICVKRTSGPGYTYQCSDNPCGANALSCTCAASLCQAGTTCSVSGTTLSCICSMCL
jgi:hypothetical protein